MSIRFIGCCLLGVLSSVGAMRAQTDVPDRARSVGFHFLAFDPITPSTLYAGADSGVFKSTDGGGTWTRVGSVPTPSGPYGHNLRLAAIDPSSPSTLYAGTGNGLFKSTDGGGTWAAAGSGLAAWPISSLAINPSTPSTLYAGTGVGAVFKSTDGGGTWVAVYSGATPAGFNPSVSLAIDPSTPSTVYAAVSRVYKSTDGGTAWAAGSERTIRSGVTHVDSLVIDPSTPSTLFAGTDIGVFKSTDRGETWVATNLALATSILAIDPSSPSTLYAVANLGPAGPADAGLFKSMDGGGTWAAADSGLKLPTEPAGPRSTGRNPPAMARKTRISFLVIDPSHPSTLYAGTTAGGEVFKSTDGGRTWTALVALHAELLRALVPGVKVPIEKAPKRNR